LDCPPRSPQNLGAPIFGVAALARWADHLAKSTAWPLLSVLGPVPLHHPTILTSGTYIFNSSRTK
jgi:hypothetical protein